MVYNITSMRAIKISIIKQHESNKDAHEPGVMQLESNLASVGKTSPFSKAFLIFSSASFADL